MSDLENNETKHEQDQLKPTRNLDNGPSDQRTTASENVTNHEQRSAKDINVKSLPRSKLTVATQVATVLLSIISIGLLYFLSSQQSKVARKALAEAEKSDSVNHNNFIIENRPWVGLKNIEYGWDKHENAMVVQFTFQNYGKLPALHVEGGTSHPTISAKAPHYQPYYVGGASISVGVISPAGQLFQRIPETIGSSKMTQILQGRKRMYISGMVTYTDVFHQADTTIFSYFWNGKDWVPTQSDNEMK